MKAEGRRQRTYPGAQGVGLGEGLQLGTGKEGEHRGAREETGRTGEKKKVITGRKFREQQKCIKSKRNQNRSYRLKSVYTNTVLAHFALVLQEQM